MQSLLGGTLRFVELTRSGTICRVIVSRQSAPRGLSAREREVVERLVRGQCQKAIGYALGLGATTVSTHVRATLDKLGITRSEQAVLVSDGGRS